MRYFTGEWCLRHFSYKRSTAETISHGNDENGHGSTSASPTLSSETEHRFWYELLESCPNTCIPLLDPISSETLDQVQVLAPRIVKLSWIYCGRFHDTDVEKLTMCLKNLKLLSEITFSFTGTNNAQRSLVLDP